MINLYGQVGARMMTRENIHRSPFKVNGGFTFYTLSVAFLGLPVVRMWQLRSLFGDSGTIRDGSWPGFRAQLEREWNSATLFVSFPLLSCLCDGERRGTLEYAGNYHERGAKIRTTGC